MRVLSLDPGETTGWFFKDTDTGEMKGGTIGKDHYEVSHMISYLDPDIVIMETFHMYPGKAKSLSWNSFYPCEVIGVIKLTVRVVQEMRKNMVLIQQAPSIKKYAGGFQEDWDYFKNNCLKEKVTEHVKDAYLHFKYWERNKKTV